MFVYDYIDDSVNPGNYALIGAASQLAGFSRMTISLTVIVVELTNEMTYLLPIMLTITISQWTGNLFTVSMYDIVIYLRKIPFLPPLLPPHIDKLVAEEIMIDAKNVITVEPVMKVRELVRKLTNEGGVSHNGFPVVQAYISWAGERKKLVIGTILRGQIVSLIQQKVWKKGCFVPKQNDDVISPRSLGTINRKQTLSVRFRSSPSFGDLDNATEGRPSPPPASESGATANFEPVDEVVSATECSRSFSESELQDLTAPDASADASTLIVELAEEELNEWVDLTLFMDASPVTVYRKTPFRRLYRIFLQMGMRHMCVVGEDSSLLGLVTRKDLWNHAKIRLSDSCIRFNMRSGF